MASLFNKKLHLESEGLLKVCSQWCCHWDGHSPGRGGGLLQWFCTTPHMQDEPWTPLSSNRWHLITWFPQIFEFFETVNLRAKNIKVLKCFENILYIFYICIKYFYKCKWTGNISLSTCEFPIFTLLFHATPAFASKTWVAELLIKWVTEITRCSLTAKSMWESSHLVNSGVTAINLDLCLEVLGPWIRTGTSLNTNTHINTDMCSHELSDGKLNSF